jgi:N-acetylmuramoyl-L-alanine amidase
LPLPPPATNAAAVSAPVAARSWPAEWDNAWVPLESWGRFNGLAKPVQLSGGMEPLFQLQTSNGVALVKIGSHVAFIDGLQYGLGFAPRLFRGLPYIHSLDARKTFQVMAGALFTPPATNRTIILDPGHGGRDSGTHCSIGCEAEKHHALDWALRLAPLLAARGWQVVLTRTNDVDLSLADRVALANRVRATVFLSLHFNSGGANRELNGLETYCLTPTGLPSNLVREYEDDPREAYPNNAFDDQNLQFASRLHRSVLRATGAADRGVRRARFMTVLQGQNRPAVLIEGGYLSNPDEARRIATPEYRQALAEGVARALE